MNGKMIDEVVKMKVKVTKTKTNFLTKLNSQGFLKSRLQIPMDIYIN